MISRHLYFLDTQIRMINHCLVLLTRIERAETFPLLEMITISRENSATLIKCNIDIDYSQL